MSRTSTVPVVLVCAIGLAAAIAAALGKKGQTLEGILVQEGSTYTFLQGAKSCERRGTPYLVLPNHGLYAMLPRTSVDVEHFNEALHGTWQVKLNGDVSHLGLYGVREKYWREPSVNYLVDRKQLLCK